MTLIKTYKQFPIKIVKGKGSFVWDDEGKKYLDFYGGHAVALIGHCPSSVVAAINSQSKKLMFYSNIFHTEPAEALGKKLAKTLAPANYQVYLANSGSEANETAIKMARKHTGKKHIVSFKNAFHGRSITAIAVTGIDSYHQFEPNLDKFTTFAELGNLQSVERAISEDTAAVICEPIQSIGGMNKADADFYKKLAALCKRKGILLIFDEVQTGLGRTGEIWFSKKIGVQPDIITTAKGLASGLPISAVMVRSAIAEKIKVGEHATTFGGGPVVCAAAMATLDVILKKGFLNDVREKSEYLQKKLLKLPAVEAVLGEGLLLGIKLVEPAPGLVEKCLKNGLIIGNSCDPTVFRIMPPLTITKKEIDIFLHHFSLSLTQ